MVLDSVFRMGLPSRYGRDVLCVNIRHPAASGAILRLLNVHLDSLDMQFRRAVQLVLDELLREPGCNGGIIAGNFNAIHRTDYTLVESLGWSMPGSRCTGARRGLMKEPRGVWASNSRTDSSQVDWTRSLCWACSLTRSRFSNLVSSTSVHPGATTAGCNAPSPSNTVGRSFLSPCSTAVYSVVQRRTIVTPLLSAIHILRLYKSVR